MSTRRDTPSEPPSDHLGLLRDPEAPATPEERRLRSRAREAVAERVTAQPSARGTRIAITRSRNTAIDCGRHVSAQPDEDTVALCDPGAWIDPEEQGS